MVSNFWEVGFSLLYEWMKDKMIRKGAIQFPQLECSAMHYGKFLSFNPNPLYTFFAAKRISDTSQLQANSKITSAATTQYLRSCFSQSFHQCSALAHLVWLCFPVCTGPTSSVVQVRGCMVQMRCVSSRPDPGLQPTSCPPLSSDGISVLYWHHSKYQHITFKHSTFISIPQKPGKSVLFYSKT